MALLWEAYRWIAEHGAHERAVRPLGRRLRSELAALASLAPFMQSDLNAQIDPKWVCTDASDIATAPAVSHVGSSTAREALRYQERQGYFARPLGEAAGGLRAKDISDAQDVEEWTVCADQKQSPTLDDFDVLWIGVPAPRWSYSFAIAGHARLVALHEGHNMSPMRPQPRECIRRRRWRSC